MKIFRRYYEFYFINYEAYMNKIHIEENRNDCPTKIDINFK